MPWTLNRETAKRFLDDFKENIESNSPTIKIEYFCDKRDYLSNTIKCDDGTFKINVYSESFANLNPIEDYSKANLTLFAISIVSLLYECRCIQQTNNQLVKISTNDKASLADYKSYENKYSNVIDAEIFALIKARHILENAFPFHGEQLVLKYLNYRIDENINKKLIYCFNFNHHFYILDDMLKEIETILS